MVGSSRDTLDVPDLCSTCATMSTQDALALKTFEIVEIAHNACAPITTYTCRCRSCAARWIAIEVFDEEGQRASEWSWSRAQ